MAESNPISVSANEEEGINALSLLGRAEEENKAILQKEISSPTDQNKEETDVEDTSIVSTRDVKAPNLFDRAKEEMSAIAQTIHTTAKRSVSEADSLLHGKFEKAANLMERGKEEIGAIIRKRKEKSANEHNESETHGLRDDIDETTALNEVKGPSVLERAKEEFEAIVGAINPKKEPTSTPTSSNTVDAAPSSSDGFWLSIGRQLEKFCCSPFDRKKD